MPVSLAPALLRALCVALVCSSAVSERGTLLGEGPRSLQAVVAPPGMQTIGSSIPSFASDPWGVAVNALGDMAVVSR